MPDLFQAMTQSATSTQSSETCSLQEEASFNSREECPAATYPLGPSLQPALSMRMPTSSAQTHPVTGWISTDSSPVQLRMLASGEVLGGPVPAPTMQARGSATGGTIPPRGRSPLSSFYPLHGVARVPETSAAPPGDRSRDYGRVVGGSQTAAGAVPRRERSRSPEEARQLRIADSFPSVARVMNINSIAARASVDSQSAATQHRAQLPVVLSFVQARGIPVGPRLAEGLVASTSDGVASQVHHHALPERT